MTTRRVYNDRSESGIGSGAYRDTGCDLCSSCIQCVFPYCRYDTEDGGGQARLTQRHEELVWTAWGDGLEVPEIAARTGLSRRTVYRYLKEE